MFLRWRGNAAFPPFDGNTLVLAGNTAGFLPNRGKQDCWILLGFAALMWKVPYGEPNFQC